jgi:hypothetical protein
MVANGGEGTGHGVPLGDRTNKAKTWQHVAGPMQERIDARGNADGQQQVGAKGARDVLVVGGVAKGGFGNGFLAASPNEEARIAREAAEASRLERLRQARQQVCVCARARQQSSSRSGRLREARQQETDRERASERKRGGGGEGARERER